MARFQYSKKEHSKRNYIVSIVVFIIVIGLFYYGVQSVSSRTDAEQLASLESALQQSITHCYAVEGSYPESLTYLKEHYGISYDEDKYFVDYRPSAANIMPDVTIIEKGGSKR